MAKGYKQMIAEAEARIDTLSIRAAAEALRRPGTVFVDLRDRRELEREGRIPGAFHCPRGMLEFWIDPESPYHKPVFAEGRAFVFYCASGWRSALGARTAMEMGLPGVSHIGGGFSVWKAEGGAVEEVPKRA